MRSTGHTYAQPRGLTHVADASYINSSHKLHIKSMQHNIWSGGRSQPLPMPYARASEGEQASRRSHTKQQNSGASLTDAKAQCTLEPSCHT